mgnify:CR=1 FL=1
MRRLKMGWGHDSGTQSPFWEAVWDMVDSVGGCYGSAPDKFTINYGGEYDSSRSGKTGLGWLPALPQFMECREYGKFVFPYEPDTEWGRSLFLPKGFVSSEISQETITRKRPLIILGTDEVVFVHPQAGDQVASILIGGCSEEHHASEGWFRQRFWPAPGGEPNKIDQLVKLVGYDRKSANHIPVDRQGNLTGAAREAAKALFRAEMRFRGHEEQSTEWEQSSDILWWDFLQLHRVGEWAYLVDDDEVCRRRFPREEIGSKFKNVGDAFVLKIEKSLYAVKRTAEKRWVLGVAQDKGQVQVNAICHDVDSNMAATLFTIARKGTQARYWQADFAALVENFEESVSDLFAVIEAPVPDPAAPPDPNFAARV